jgi:UDP-3-O-[3-hydroxymyristoyl] N-acetylglucosamine deacetylase
MQNMMAQKTIARSIEITGIGLHKGEKATITLKPAEVNSGICFVRVDGEKITPIEANFKNIVNTQMATTLGKGKTAISTTEHVMAAIAGFGIDNLLIEVMGPELPIMDGSSAPFCRAILEAGIAHQSAPRRAIRLKKRIEVKVEDKWAVAEPSDAFEVVCSIDWDHPMIGFQHFHYVDGKTDFSEIASARTFGFVKDVEQLKKIGLALGGSLDNAVVLDQALVLNPDGLRYPDEFVRHKVLDAIGDFKLSGVQILGRFKLHRAGHELHRQILVEIFKDASNYEWVYSSDDSISASKKSHSGGVSPMAALKAAV